MTDPELPQPIYPPSSGGGGSSWGAPAAPTAPAGPPPGPPPSSPPTGGYGSFGNAPGSGGFAPSGSGGSGLGKGKIIAIIAAVAIVGGIIAGAIAAGNDDGDGDDRGDRTATTPGSGTSTGSGDGSARTVAEVQFAGLSQATIDCAATELEADPEVLDSLVGDTAAVIEDGALAQRFASIAVGCSNTGELVGMLEATLVQSDWDPSLAACAAGNAQGFGTTQWEQFLASSVQPAEAASAASTLEDLAAYC